MSCPEHTRHAIRLLYLLIASLCLSWFSCHEEPPLSPPSGTPRPRTPRFAIAPQHDIPWPSLANSPWPMAQHDPQRTGRSPYQGPQAGQIEWVLKIGDITPSVALGPDGTIYCAVMTRAIDSIGLYAIAPQGTIKWIFRIPATLYNAPLVAADGTIYIGAADNRMYAVNPDGTLKWRFPTDSRIYLDGSVLGLDGTLYFVSNKGTLYALNLNGTLKWQLFVDYGFAGGSPTSLSMSPDGTTLYVGGGVNVNRVVKRGLYAVSTHGAVQWSDSLRGKMALSPLVDSDGNIYVVTDSVTYSFNPDGSIRWTYQGPRGVGLNHPTMDRNGNLYFLVESYSAGGWYIYCLDYAGQLRWKALIPERWFGVSLVNDADGTVYVGGTGGADGGRNIYAVSNGSIKWQIPLNGDPALNCPAIDRNGHLYLPTTSAPNVHKGERLYKIK